ncbi:hypothetical protein AB0J63_19745 [Streptosporangium canum]|uniref:hypothetical protein n=1 Tax=Streptosporangium canum TaxID=324952 RepID=UPI0034478CF6
MARERPAAAMDGGLSVIERRREYGAAPVPWCGGSVREEVSARAGRIRPRPVRLVGPYRSAGRRARASAF